MIARCQCKRNRNVYVIGAFTDEHRMQKKPTAINDRTPRYAGYGISIMNLQTARIAASHRASAASAFINNKRPRPKGGYCEELLENR